MFDASTSQDARPIALLKRTFLILLALFLVIGIVSGHRAYYQVRSLELQLTGPVLSIGSVIQTAVVGSGRTTIDVQLELIQGPHSERLAVQRVPGNEWAFFDPRPTRASQKLVVTPEHLARFTPGTATIRTTATGRPQWTRLPPPTVREISVEIKR